MKRNPQDCNSTSGAPKTEIENPNKGTAQAVSSGLDAQPNNANAVAEPKPASLGGEGAAKVTPTVAEAASESKLVSPADVKKVTKPAAGSFRIMAIS
jgi:hypothetical protein